MLCPDIPFTIILPPAEEGVSLTIRVLAEDLPNVTLIDHQIGYDDAQQYFDTASVFLYSGVVGTDPPITLLQAAMGGSMIVSTYLDPDNEMLSEGGCGILERDYTRAAEIIKRACTDESFRLLYVKRAFEYVTTHYGYDTMLDSYTQEIERLAAL
jgi:glycosyltransferase involved in cell wall biosynthesis